MPGSGKSFKDIDGGPEMVLVPAGAFVMGSPDAGKDTIRSESPAHMVIIAQPFAIGRYAVTFDEWDAAVADGGCGGYKPSDDRSFKAKSVKLVDGGKKLEVKGCVAFICRTATWVRAN